MGKTILYGADARNALLAGVDFLAKAVASSLGPAGRNTVIFNRRGGVMISKDGVTIAESIEAEDLATDAGVQLVKQVARKTADRATELTGVLYRCAADCNRKPEPPSGFRVRGRTGN